MKLALTLDARAVLNMAMSVLAALSAVARDARADVRLPRLVADNMVLQRDAPLQVWGWADAGERVRLEFRGRRFNTTAGADGRWSVPIAAQRAGGPFDMRIAGKNAISIKNILVGDVWLASGQSNMQFPMARDAGFGGVANETEEIAGASLPLMRLFAVQRMTALRPADEVGAPDASGWQVVTPSAVRSFSAVAYLFGRELHQKYRVPVGLIEADWGGTPAETWVSARAAKKFPDLAAAVERESHIGADETLRYESYLEARNRWYRLHGREDRGQSAGHSWAAANFDATDWPTAMEPQPWPVKTAKNFDGTVWFRKEIDLLPSDAGRALRLRLSHMLQADTSYFNGEKVGETTGETAARDYAVPARLVTSGRNIVAVRLEGQYASGDGYVGMLGEAAQMYADLGTRKISLAGAWRYQPGPDLSGLPVPPPLDEFRGKYPQAPALLFNAMIAPLGTYRIKGVIWYQGESNVGRAAQYRVLFPALINDWRALWGYEVPFLFVQLAGFGSDPPEPADCARAELRDAQAAALSLPATGMATAIDLGDQNDIHPRNKQEVAHRLALAAARVAYGERLVHSGPVYRSMRIDGARVRLAFINQSSTLRVPQSGELRGFTIAAEQGSFVRAHARVQGDEVIVWSDAVPVPAAVRYDWGNFPDGNLDNLAALPAAPFRTGR